ncbi:MAG TPA: glycerol kinase GlpK [Gemmatirosa sp.]
MPSILAIDQGTTGTTCLVVDTDGRVRGRAYRELTQHYPAPGLVEHDPVEILRTVRDAATEAVARAGAPPSAVGITNQRETVVLWERATGHPVHPAIVWQDRRTAERCRALSVRAAWLAEHTGLVPDPYFSGTKLEWLLARPDPASGEPLRVRAERGELAFGTVDSWLVWHLTGGRVHATDPTNASRTLLYNIGARAWSDALCAEFGVARAVLPEVRPSMGDFGRMGADWCGTELPILGVAGDQQAALFGHGGWDAGAVKNTYGTGAFLLQNCGPVRPPGGGGLLTTLACDAAGQSTYALEASVFVAGAAVQWLRDGLGVLGTAAESEAAARSVASTDGVYFVPALVGLGAPDWESEARGTIVGLTRGTTAAHLVRAALEAMAYATADVLDAMRGAAGATTPRAPGAIDRLRVDGGATANSWLMQFQADVLGVAVERPALVESTALGAAGLAGLAAGIWSSPDHFLGAREATVFRPGAGATAAQAGRAGWRRAVRAALAWARDAG